MTTQQGRHDLAQVTPAPFTADAVETILEQTYANGDDWWRDCFERAASWLADATCITADEPHRLERRIPFTADDVRDLGVPEPDHSARWGAGFAALRRRGVIEPVGFTVSTRKARHGGVLRVWRGVPAGLGVTR